jgi:alpha-N-arabinofuranosidase
MKFRNPIVSGYNPDPSICRVGEDFYLVNSTFEYFPGVPVYHSKNLVNWEMLGYCLSRSSQLPLEGCRASGGIYAPTLRYHNGTFFMITTNVSGGGNFIVHATDPAGPWSEPAWVDQGGIDPSLLFDDDGKVYLTSTGVDENGRFCITMSEVDPFSGRRLTECRVLSHGCGGRYPEGPHLYKWFGKYYLMLAEGGTEYGHMETLQRADAPYGPYTPCPHNPILSHKEDWREKIYCTGHADITEDQNGNWWMVCLAIRTCSTDTNRVLLHNLGRETFLAPVVWDKEGWPTVGENGLISPDMNAPLPGPASQPVCRDFVDDFSAKDMPLAWNWLRNPKQENYRRDTAGHRMILHGTDTTLSDVASPTWMGIRQKGFETVTTVSVSAPAGPDGVRTGLTAFYNDSYHYEIYLTRQNGRLLVCLARQIHDLAAVTASAELPCLSESASVTLQAVTDKERYRFFYSIDGENFVLLGSGLTVGLCTESTRTMTFTGTYLALFAEKGTAAFENFTVKVLDN